ncbi:MAG: hypothetical protein ACXABY_31455 [Candidatus Thorarchaeota archaeon]|jgi:hypothetical protein
MTTMATQSLLYRIKFLEGDISNLNIKIQGETDGDVVASLQEQITEKNIRIDENKQWLRVLEKDPGYGMLENVEGSYIPKMPTFKTAKERDYALENREHLREEDADTTEQQFLGTREMVKRHHNQLAIERMDGEGPYAVEDVDGQEA